MEKVKNFIDYVEGRYSLTKIIFLVFVLRLVFTGASIGEALVVFVLAANYCHKRFEDYKHQREQDKESDLNMVMLQNQMDEIKSSHASVAKVAEETQKLLSQGNLSKSMVPRSLRQ